MSFLRSVYHYTDPSSRVLGGQLDLAGDALKKKSPPPTPGVPDPNQAANNAQNLTDQMRMRRGLMSNLYAGAQTGPGSAPVTGKTALGT